MIWVTGALCLWMCVAGNSGMAQDWDDWEDYDTGEYISGRKGVEFALNFGVYQANHQAANAFYNGYAGEFYDLGDNTANLMTIEDRLGVDSPNSIVWSQIMNSIGLEAGEFMYIEYRHTRECAIRRAHSWGCKQCSFSIRNLRLFCMWMPSMD